MVRGYRPLGMLGFAGLGAMVSLEAASMSGARRSARMVDLDMRVPDHGPVSISMPDPVGFSMVDRIREATRTARQPQVARTRCLTMGDGEPTAPGLQYKRRPPPSLEAAASSVERAGDKRARREARRRALAARSSSDV